MAKSLKMKYILLSEKSWHRQLFHDVSRRVKADWKLIDKKQDFTRETLDAFKPDKIFIPHWSYLIGPEIYESFECIVFHMTDLPFGRGGSPLQNLIERGYNETRISALRVEKGLDAGKIYLKRPLSLHGTAQEIFLRSAEQIGDMIVELHNTSIIPTLQVGEPVVFQRRSPEQSNVEDVSEIQKLYDYIRMLDCDGYPQAFIETEHFRFEFTRPAFKDYQTLIADVRIIKK